MKRYIESLSGLLAFVACAMFAAFAFSLPILAVAEETTATVAGGTGLLSGKPELNVDFQATEVLVPIAFFLTLAAVIFIVHYMRYRQSQEIQQSIRLMVEKGVEIPKELLLPTRRRMLPQSDLRRGLVLTALGVVLPIAMFINEPGNRDWVWGIIPLAIGIAYLISFKVERREEKAAVL